MVKNPKDRVIRTGKKDNRVLPSAALYSKKVCDPWEGQGMTWIQTTSFDDAGPGLREIYEALYRCYPPEYGVQVPAVRRPDGGDDSIIAAHSFIPEAMRHAFGTHLAVLAPDLPLSRAQHEMIATVVSAQNHCFY
jgi:hypothetical protein